MQKQYVYKLVISDGEKDVYTEPLSHEMVNAMASSFPDTTFGNGFFEYACTHPSMAVRENIAWKEKISEKVCDVLSTDSSISVLRRLVRNRTFKKFASTDLLEKFISIDIEIAQSIAEDIELFSSADVTVLSTLLSEHHDPMVVASLAGNSRAPKKILRSLVSHPDSDIAQKAIEHLER